MRIAMVKSQRCELYIGPIVRPLPNRDSSALRSFIRAAFLISMQIYFLDFPLLNIGSYETLKD